MAASGPFDSLGTILSSVAKRFGLDTRLHELRLQHDWPALVGEPLASHAWPVDIRSKKLYLLVPNSVWLQQLTFLKPALLEKLNRAAGQPLVTDIVLRVGDIPAPSTPPRSPSGSASPHPLAPSEEIAAHTAAIQDPDLRRYLTEVIATYPSRPPSRAEADR